MWIRRTPQGWALARPLQSAAALLAAFAAFGAGLALFASLTVAGVDFLYVLPMAATSYAAARTSVMSVAVRTDGVRVVSSPHKERPLGGVRPLRGGVMAWMESIRPCPTSG